MATHHTLGPTPATVHWGYLDAKIPPRLTIDSGDTVTIETVSGGLADVGDTSIMLPHHREICEQLKPSPGPHILTGPIAVRGAEPGDALEVRIKAIELTVDWGWNLIRPLRGTLPEDYPDFRCRIIPIDRSAMTARLPWGPSIPLSPFFGIMAVAPPAAIRAVLLGRAARVRRQHGQQGAAGRARRSIFPCSCPAPTSRPATGMPCKATARSASRRWRPA